MQAKKQQLRFSGIKKGDVVRGDDGRKIYTKMVLFVTSNFDFCIENSTTDPYPLNRKTRRAIDKITNRSLSLYERNDLEEKEKNIKAKKLARRQRRIDQKIKEKNDKQ